MIARKYIGPIKYLGGASIIILLIGLIYDPLSNALLPADAHTSVLVSSIPFVAVFITIILLFMLCIFIVALRFNRLIPYRSYRPVEMLIIFGIACGVFFLFQPWQLVSFRYGFLCLLISTLSFILWSHVVPHGSSPQQESSPWMMRYWMVAAVLMVLAALFAGIEYAVYLLLSAALLYILWTNFRPSAGMNGGLPPFSLRDNILGLIPAVLVAVLVASVIITVTLPQEPYGYSQRQWDRGLRDEQKAEIIAQADTTYRQFTLPFSIFIALLPAGAAFFITREVAASINSRKEEESAAAQKVAASQTSGT